MVQNVSTAVMQRAEAIKLGIGWYFTGEPCPQGHIAKRSVSNRDCRRCSAMRTTARRAADPDPFREKDRARQGDARRTTSRMSRLKHIAKRRQYDSDRYHNDGDRKAATKVRAVQWGRTNKGERAAIIAARRMAIKQATPPWLTAEQKDDIRAFYIEAARRPGEWHVDHIYPINGKTSCGLHVPWNLQILTGDDNRRKGNRVYDAE